MHMTKCTRCIGIQYVHKDKCRGCSVFSVQCSVWEAMLLLFTGFSSIGYGRVCTKMPFFIFMQSKRFAKTFKFSRNFSFKNFFVFVKTFKKTFAFQKIFPKTFVFLNSINWVCLNFVTYKFCYRITLCPTGVFCTPYHDDG